MVMIINEEEGKDLLTMGECIDLMEDVFREFGRGNGVNPPRLRYSCPTPDPKANYFANIHAGALPKYGVAAVRLNSRLTEEKDDETRRVEFQHPTRRYWGQFLIYSLETAELLGIIVDGSISPLRVGATAAPPSACWPDRTPASPASSGPVTRRSCTPGRWRPPFPCNA